VTVETPAWARDAIFYQVFPDRFASSDRVRKPGPLEPWDTPPTEFGFKGGDLLGLTERLPYLEDLGINAIYLTPIFASAANHRYHTYDYLTVDPLLGGEAALRELLDAAHGRGMRVVLDGVFNHTGRGFWAFHHVLETGAASPYRSWFHFDEQRLDEGRPILAYPTVPAREGVSVDEPVPGEPSPTRDGSASLTALGYRAWWDLPALPKLNTGDPGVREHLFEVAEHWLRFGIDGWRLDVPEEIDDEGFWQEFRRRCRAVRPDAYLVGEIWRVAPEWLAGDRFDALMNYPLGEAILSFTGGTRLDLDVIRSHHEYGAHVAPLDGPAFGARLDDLLTAYDPAVVSVQLNLIGSHDTPRALTVLGRDKAALRLAILLQATLPGAPCVYYGDEIGLEGGIDPDCRRAFPWLESAWDRELHAFVRTALRLRRAETVLRRGSTAIVGAAGRAIAFERHLDGTRLVVAINAGEEPASLSVTLPGATGRLATIPLPGDERGTEHALTDGTTTLELPARTGRLLRLA
jgi:cyclomaltodextrinase